MNTIIENMNKMLEKKLNQKPNKQNLTNWGNEGARGELRGIEGGIEGGLRGD